MATLKISDLSVGDWVKVSGMAKRVHNIEFQNGEYFVHFSDPDTNSEDYLHAPFIDPIPITAEILENNGWENLRSGYKCSCGVYDIHIWIKEASVIVTIYERERILKAVRMQVYSPDMSVHQLQHILRLAGVDKEINL